MLTHLQIRDFAIVDQVEIEFGAGLTVLTGETGAGKSIVVDALQLLAGGRAATDSIRHGAERADLSAQFDLGNAPSSLLALLAEQSIDVSEGLLLRRVIAADGKSRAYVNGQTVAQQVLRDIGSELIDIHGQHEFQSLMRSSAQRELLDAYGESLPARAELAQLHRELARLQAQYDELSQTLSERDARLDLLRYQTQELRALQLAPEEAASLALESARLTNRGRLANAARAAAELVYEAETANAHDLCARALSQLRNVSALDPKIGELLPTLESAATQLREAAHGLAGYLESLDVDPARIEHVEQRLAAIEALARKHRVTAAELTPKLTELEQEQQRLESAERSLAELARQLETQRKAWHAHAEQLSSARQAAARRWSRSISASMQTLGMAGGRFDIAVMPDVKAAPAAHGFDQIEFLVSANPGQPLKALAKVASGGELSRISLAIQVTLAARESRCLVFDEVDSGVGGAVAEIVGRELASLGTRAQVLCVTHLPQVAAQASAQLKVNKLTDGRSTRTTLTRLSGAQRIEEIARMLGGVTITARAREHASEMLTANDVSAARPHGASNPRGGSVRKAPSRGR